MRYRYRYQFLQVKFDNVTYKIKKYKNIALAGTVTIFVPKFSVGKTNITIARCFVVSSYITVRNLKNLKNCETFIILMTVLLHTNNLMASGITSCKDSPARIFLCRVEEGYFYSTYRGVHWF